MSTREERLELRLQKEAAYSRGVSRASRRFYSSAAAATDHNPTKALTYAATALGVAGTGPQPRRAGEAATGGFARFPRPSVHSRPKSLSPQPSSLESRRDTVTSYSSVNPPQLQRLSSVDDEAIVARNRELRLLQEKRERAREEERLERQKQQERLDRDNLEANLIPDSKKAPQVSIE